MSNEQIRCEKENIATFLGRASAHKFIIPEYQREYAWEEDNVKDLFEDIWNFTLTRFSNKNNLRKTYFLGSSVVFLSGEEETVDEVDDDIVLDEAEIISKSSSLNDNDEYKDSYCEVIDGQQRITSLFLLLRVVYDRLESSEIKDEKTLDYMRDISKILWVISSEKKVFKDKPLLESKVIDSDLCSVLHGILETGKSIEDKNDNYSKNYRLFQKLYKEKSEISPQFMFNFIETILNYVIVLPIIANSQDTALTIFSTLNDRGLPLSESDIFKVNIYKKVDDKKAFTDKWTAIESDAKKIGESIQRLFYYYMFFIRAERGDTNTTTPGLKKFYEKNKFAELHKPELMDKLDSILNFLYVVYYGDVISEEDGYNFTEEWSKDNNIRKSLDILTSYPNEFWKYPVITYYIKHKDDEHFATLFLKFLRKLIYELIVKYIDMPTISAVKANILKLNKDAYLSNQPKFDFAPVEYDNLQERLVTPHDKIVRMLLKIYAYSLPEQDILPEKWEIEHIFPQKWQTNFFPNNVNEDEVQEKIEHIGNKTPLEKKWNCSASNGYFESKRKKYLQSNVIITKKLANHKKEERKDWDLEDIGKRDEFVSAYLFNTLISWNSDYSTGIQQEAPQPTPEELQMIEQLRSKGLIP